MAGFQPTQSFAIELGHTFLQSHLTQISSLVNATGASVTIRARHRNIYSDVLGYYPLTEQVNLVGAVGLGYLQSKIDVVASNTGVLNIDGQGYSDSSKLGPRLGAGLQGKLADQVTSRFMVTYQNGNEVFKNLTTAGVGIFYHF
jgi:hypothetical protein